MSTRKTKKVKSGDMEKELAEIDMLFRDLENDKSLPTFGSHFMQCLMLGLAEHVNLKAMYPKTYTRLSKWLEKHNKRILSARKRR